jgi:hypothetical protein
MNITNLYKRLTDGQSTPEARAFSKRLDLARSRTISFAYAEIGDQMLRGLVSVTLTAFTAALGGMAATAILGDPEFLSGVLAKVAYSYCLATGVCQFSQVYPAIGVALIILWLLLALLVFLVFGIIFRPPSAGEIADDVADEMGSRFEVLHAKPVETHEETGN